MTDKDRDDFEWPTTVPAPTPDVFPDEITDDRTGRNDDALEDQQRAVRRPAQYPKARTALTDAEVETLAWLREHEEGDDATEGL